jgi:hypothetical protein
MPTSSKLATPYTAQPSRIATGVVVVVVVAVVVVTVVSIHAVLY